MDFPTNNYLISEKEVELALLCVAKQIKHAEEESDVKARVFGYRDYRPFRGGRHDHFNKDALRRAIRIIKEHGWHCWEHTDCEDELTIWVTASGMCPHKWFSEC